MRNAPGGLPGIGLDPAGAPERIVVQPLALFVLGEEQLLVGAV